MNSVFSTLLILIVFLGIFAGGALAEAQPSPKFQSQEMSEKDGVPVLVEHLPDFERVRSHAAFAKSLEELKRSLGDRPTLDLIDFSAGTEAVTAPYDAGKLLIVEFTSPQGSVDADNKIKAKLDEINDGKTAYRRIGNYNVLVFDVSDMTAANTLIDQVKYEKQIQWLGENPFRINPERAFVLTTTDIFISTVLVIVIGIGISIIGGILVGYLYFRITDKRRTRLSTFTDAGGMTRLNLDGFTPDIASQRLLEDKSTV